MWSIVVIAILVILIVSIAALTFWTMKENSSNLESQTLVPFNGYLSPSGKFWTVNSSSINTGVGKEPENGLYLAESDGTPQIQCPIGTSVNIVGAFLDVVDPYGECSGTSDPTLLSTCGSQSSTQTCSSTSDCPPGMTCNSGVCSPMTCTGANNTCGSIGTVPVCNANLGSSCSTDCGTGLQCVGGICEVDPGQGSCMACVDPISGFPLSSTDSSTPGTCSFMPVCSNTIQGQNGTCAGNGSAGCRPRDASAYLANHCDGQQSCLGDESDMWIPGKSGGAFGPLPCQIPADSTNSDYASLPVSMGWNGAVPQDSSDGTADPANFNQGYYVHGIYTCTPN